MLPVGRPAKFTITSVDVIHSFWVPEFGQKKDAVPGIETTSSVTPKHTGEFAVVCTESVRPRARDDAREGARRDPGRVREVGQGAERVTATHPEQRQQYPAHFEPPHGSTWRLSSGPGLLRGAWMGVLGFALGTALVSCFAAGWAGTPVWNTQIVLVVGGMVVAPIFFLAGIGAFDYWLYYISGRPDAAGGPLGSRRASVEDYFRVNTDHKVIGIQYLVTTFVFFVDRRPAWR